jgi:hypothetical protein
VGKSTKGVNAHRIFLLTSLAEGTGAVDRDKQEAAALQREAHARLVVERDQDCRYTQRESRDGQTTYTLSRPTAATIAAQLEEFRKKFARDPELGEPVFFDPDEETPVQISPEKLRALVSAEILKSGQDPARADAYRLLGYLVSDGNRHLYTAFEVDAWDRAIAASRSASPPTKSATKPQTQRSG